jgi:hypothetical protein
VKRLASVTYDSVLAADERDSASRELASAGATVTSWNVAAGRTYAALACVPNASLPAALAPGARSYEPPLAVLRVEPDAARNVSALHEAFSGPGRLSGVLDARVDGPAVVIEVDATVTPLALVVAAIDAELSSSPGRRIEPLLPLDDATLVAFAGALLSEPDLSVSRLIETHLEPLLGAPR